MLPLPVCRGELKMTTITYHSSGGDKGRCDAKCHDAKHPICDCICGGINHGVGLKQAIENTGLHFGEMVREYEKAHPGESVEVFRSSIQDVMEFGT